MTDKEIEALVEYSTADLQPWQRDIDPVTAWYKQGVQDTGLIPHKKTVDQ